MRRHSLVALLVCAVSLLTACQASGPGKGSMAPSGANAVTGDPIEVTALDPAPGEDADPKAGSAAGQEGSKTEGTKTAGTKTAAPQGAPETQPNRAVETPAAADVTAVEEAVAPAPKPDLDAFPVASKSEKQLACEKKKGRWAKVGNGDVRACVYQTRDSGKRCERESQCDSVCLARSGTCAPFKPMYGCNEILQDNGARVTLCLD